MLVCTSSRNSPCCFGTTYVKWTEKNDKGTVLLCTTWVWNTPHTDAVSDKNYVHTDAVSATK